MSRCSVTLLCRAIILGLLCPLLCHTVVPHYHATPPIHRLQRVLGLDLFLSSAEELVRAAPRIPSSQNISTKLPTRRSLNISRQLSRAGRVGETAGRRRSHRGHNYIGHNHVGHDYIGHNYIGHNHVGHNYTGRDDEAAERRARTAREREREQPSQPAADRGCFFHRSLGACRRRMPSGCVDAEGTSICRRYALKRDPRSV